MESPPRASNEEQRSHRHSEIPHPTSHQESEMLIGHTGRSDNRGHGHQEHIPLHMENDDGNRRDGGQTYWAGESNAKLWDSRERASPMDGGRTSSRIRERPMPASSHFDDGQGSEISSLSMSDEVELDQLSSPCALSDDEERGLTKTDDQPPNGRRRRRADTLDRTAGLLQLSKGGPKLADRSVFKTLFFNSLLVASWYIFSLSISLASPFPDPLRLTADKIAV